MHIAIVAAGHTSDDCAPQHPSLRVLTEAEQARVHRADERLQGMPLPAAERDFLRANLWLSHDLYGEAIAVLERLARAPGAPPAIHRLLGEAYEYVELPDRAESAYRAALAGAATSRDVEARATLSVALARVSTDQQESKQLVAQAVMLYRLLGDNQRADELAHGKG